MRCLAFIFCLVLGCLSTVAAKAEVLISVNKSSQRLAVYVDGAQRYSCLLYTSPSPRDS